MKKFALVSAALASVALVGTAIAGQNVSLGDGFTPDPSTLSVTAGGTNDASSWSAGCNGYVADRGAPDVTLNWSGSQYIRFYVTSSADTTLVINDGSGNWHCNDDYSGNNPALELSGGAANPGVIEIWIGTYDAGSYPASTLHITEMAIPGSF